MKLPLIKFSCGRKLVEPDETSANADSELIWFVKVWTGVHTAIELLKSCPATSTDVTSETIVAGADGM